MFVQGDFLFCFNFSIRQRKDEQRRVEILLLREKKKIKQMRNIWQFPVLYLLYSACVNVRDSNYGLNASFKRIWFIIEQHINVQTHVMVFLCNLNIT